MKVIEVQRGEIPQDWTDEHVRVLTHGHERGVVSKAADGPAQKVLGFASRCGVGVTVFGGLTFVDVSPRSEHGGGPVRFELLD